MKRLKKLLLFFLILSLSLSLSLAHDNVPNDSGEDKVEDDDSVERIDTSEFEEYVSPMPAGLVYFSESFDDIDEAKSKWISSQAQKEDQDNVFKYDGEWVFQLPLKTIFPRDRALVLKSKAKHAAISAKLERNFDFNTKPLFVQYEVNFQNGMDCGGAYIKLLSYSKDLDLKNFHDKTPYTIMFGPDKCGNDIKLHFIFRHKNPLNGSYEEKHAKKPSNRLEENYTDKKPHLYLLKLWPDNRYEVIVDGSLINSGSLLKDVSPQVNPEMTIEDPDDKKPADWDEREKISDTTATKPEDWDDEAPQKIPDPNADKPANWLEDEEEMIPDTTAQMPEDWDESMDGSWEPPLIANPACEGKDGCGPWSPPLVDNPNYKGKWRAPMIDNPNYKGKWTRKKVPNPDYFEDKEPFKMTSIGAVGLEIWTMTDMVLFDNFIITDDETVLTDWTLQTYDLKRRSIDRDSEGVFSRIITYSNAHPWLWAIYIFVIGLPLVLIFTFCCGSSEAKKNASDPGNVSDPKKTDEPQPDVEPEANATEVPKVETKLKSPMSKEQLETAPRDESGEEYEEDEDEEEEEEGEEENAGENEEDDDREESSISENRVNQDGEEEQDNEESDEKENETVTLDQNGSEGSTRKRRPRRDY